MKTVMGLVVADLIVDNDLVNFGEIRGRIIVTKAAKICSYGKILGNVIIESGSEMINYGVLRGDVIDYGVFLEHGKLIGNVTVHNGKYKDGPCLYLFDGDF